MRALPHPSACDRQPPAPTARALRAHQHGFSLIEALIGFLILVLGMFGTLDYAEVFKAAPKLADTTINLWGDAQWSLMTVTCICLFIGAMGKHFSLHYIQVFSGNFFDCFYQFVR